MSELTHFVGSCYFANYTLIYHLVQLAFDFVFEGNGHTAWRVDVWMDVWIYCEAVCCFELTNAIELLRKLFDEVIHVVDLI